MRIGRTLRLTIFALLSVASILFAALEFWQEEIVFGLFGVFFGLSFVAAFFTVLRPPGPVSPTPLSAWWPMILVAAAVVVGLYRQFFAQPSPPVTYPNGANGITFRSTPVPMPSTDDSYETWGKAFFAGTLNSKPQLRAYFLQLGQAAIALGPVAPTPFCSTVGIVLPGDVSGIDWSKPEEVQQGTTWPIACARHATVVSVPPVAIKELSKRRETLQRLMQGHTWWLNLTSTVGKAGAYFGWKRLASLNDTPQPVNALPCSPAGWVNCPPNVAFTPMALSPTTTEQLNEGSAHSAHPRLLRPSRLGLPAP